MVLRTFVAGALTCPVTLSGMQAPIPA